MTLAYAGIRKRATAFVAALMLAASLTACDTALTFLAGEDWQNDGTYLTKTHWRGSQADATAQTTIVARNRAEWDLLWQRVGEKPPGTLPYGKMAVAVLLGQRPNPGWQVDILEARHDVLFGYSEQFVVRWREVKPEQGKAYPAVVASPWAIRIADETTMPIVFNEVKG